MVVVVRGAANEMNFTTLPAPVAPSRPWSLPDPFREARSLTQYLYRLGWQQARMMEQSPGFEPRELAW